MRVNVKQNLANSYTIVLIRNKQVMEDLSSITRITFTIGGVVYDSDVLAAGLITWNENTIYQRYLLTQCVSVKFGLFGIPLGTYLNCEMTVYFAGDPQSPYIASDKDTIIVE